MMRDLGIGHAVSKELDSSLRWNDKDVESGF